MSAIISIQIASKLLWWFRHRQFFSLVFSSPREIYFIGVTKIGLVLKANRGKKKPQETRVIPKLRNRCPFYTLSYSCSTSEYVNGSSVMVRYVYFSSYEKRRKRKCCFEKKNVQLGVTIYFFALVSNRVEIYSIFFALFFYSYPRALLLRTCTANTFFEYKQKFSRLDDIPTLWEKTN